MTSDDDLVSNIDGIECLIFQGMLHINAGNPRRGFLSFRRALNIGHLLGIHRPTSEVVNASTLWSMLNQGDRYLVSDEPQAWFYHANYS